MKKDYLARKEGQYNVLRQLLFIITWFLPLFFWFAFASIGLHSSPIFWLMMPSILISLFGAAIFIPINDKIMGKVNKRNKLLKDGPYKYTRNPLYFAYAISLAGAVLVHISLSIYGGVVALLFFRLYLKYASKTIQEEEKHLFSKFRDYRAYYNATPKIMPRLKNFHKFVASVYKYELRAP